MYVPCSWKESSIIPFYKGGVHSDLLNYKPVSLTSVVCKSLERLISGDLMRHLEGNGILSSNQFSFRPNLSVVDQLVKVYKYVVSAHDSRNIVERHLMLFAMIFLWINLG